MAEKTYRIAILFDYITSEYSNVLLTGIRAACNHYNIQLYILPVGEIHNLQLPFDYQNLSITGLIKKENIDGLIIASGTQMHFMTKEELNYFVKSYKPIPSVSIAVEVPGIPSIVVDSSNAFKALIEHLVKVQKCKRFAIMSVRSNSSEVKNRNHLIKENLELNGINTRNVKIWKSNFDYGTTKNELDHYYSESQEFPYDAVICLNDEMAFAVVDFCKEHGLSVPEDVVVTGFDDVACCKSCIPELTTISQQIFTIGYKAVETVKDQLDGVEVQKVLTVESKAILRKSSERYAEKPVDSKYITVDTSTDQEDQLGALEWYRKKNQVFQINRFYSEMQYDISQKQLRDRIIGDVKAFGVTALAVVLYDSPIEMSAPFDFFTMPKKAELFAAFDYATGYDSNKEEKVVKFNPSKQILPPGVIKADGFGIYVLALYHNTIQYGYIMFRAGGYDVAIYDLLSKIISTIISSVHSFALVNNEHTQFRQKYDKLDIIASTDELTGLSNRRGLYEKGQTTLKFAKAMEQSGLVVYSDMDGLKKINDAYGHEAGDKAILAESIILKGNFRSNDIVARMGGDEFVMICPGLTKDAFERIRQQIDRDCEVWSATSNSPFKLSVSMGYVEYPDEKVGYQITQLLSDADSKLYIEKRRKKSLEK